MTDEPVSFRARQGWSIRRRLAAHDSYGLLLVLILCSLVVWTLETPALEAVLPTFRVLVLGATLAFALHTSGARHRTYVVCWLLVAVAVGLTIAVDGDSRLGHVVQAVGAFLLVVAVIVTIARRLAEHPVVTGSTILAAVCVYLFVGLAFATVYALAAAVDLGPLFAGVGDGTGAERVYFSFITLTTTGYGDLVPAADLTRMIAVTEALIGQIYLVTVVAVLVSNVGSTRRREPQRDASSGD
jgi:hypothetical protein